MIPLSAPSNPMGSMPIRRLVVHMSWPIMLSMLVQALYNMVDSFFVARLGGAAFEALSLAYPVQTLMIAVCTGTGVGVNALLSRRLGEKRQAAASAVALHGYFLYFLSWVLFALLGLALSGPYMAFYTADAETARYGVEYLTVVTAGSLGVCWQFAGERVLQAGGNPVGPMLIQGVGAVVNLVLDPIFIYGLFGFPRLEVIGAALATVLGQFTGMLLGLWMVRRNPAIPIHLKGFRPQGAVVGEIYRIGLPAIAIQALSTAMSMGMNKILTLFTDTGVFILGAYFKLQSFVFMPIAGINNGLTPVVSYNYGARQRERVTGAIHFALALGTAIMAAGMLVFLLLPGPLLSLFDAPPEVLRQGVPALRLLALSFPFAGVSILLCAAFQALGAPFQSLLVSLGRQAVLLFPAALVLGALLGPGAVWLSFLLAEALSFLIALLCYRQLLRSRIAALEGAQAALSSS